MTIIKSQANMELTAGRRRGGLTHVSWFRIHGEGVIALFHAPPTPLLDTLAANLSTKLKLDEPVPESMINQLADAFNVLEMPFQTEPQTYRASNAAFA